MQSPSLKPKEPMRTLLSGRDIERMVWAHRALEGWIQVAQRIAEAVTVNLEPLTRIVEMMRQWQEKMAARIAEILSIAVPSVISSLEKLPPVPASPKSALALGLVPPSVVQQEKTVAVELPANTYSPEMAEGTINGKEFFFTKPHYKDFFTHLVAEGSMTREDAYRYLGIKPNSSASTILLHESLKAIRKTTKLQGKMGCRGGVVYLKDTVQQVGFPKIP